MNGTRHPHRPIERHRRLARRWADRAVRLHTVAALEQAGFGPAASALAALPELADEASVAHAEGAVARALRDVLTQPSERPEVEQALLATLAAREAVAMARSPEPSVRQMQDLVQAVHMSAGA